MRDLPWKVVINPFGESEDKSDNIFIFDANGSSVAIITKHPVWTHLEKDRLEIANLITDTINALSIRSNEE